MAFYQWISMIQQEILGSWERVDTNEVYTFLPDNKLYILHDRNTQRTEYTYSISIKDDQIILSFENRDFKIKEISKIVNARYYFLLEYGTGAIIHFAHVYEKVLFNN